MKTFLQDKFLNYLSHSVLCSSVLLFTSETIASENNEEMLSWLVVIIQSWIADCMGVIKILTFYKESLSFSYLTLLPLSLSRLVFSFISISNPFEPGNTLLFGWRTHCLYLQDLSILSWRNMSLFLLVIIMKIYFDFYHFLR